MSQEEAVKYWIASALEDWDVAQSLLKSAKYNHALFFLQLAQNDLGLLKRVVLFCFL